MALVDGRPDALVRRGQGSTSTCCSHQLRSSTRRVAPVDRGRSADHARRAASQRLVANDHDQVVVIGLAGLAVGMLVAFVIAGSLARPLTRLADAAADSDRAICPPEPAMCQGRRGPGTGNLVRRDGRPGGAHVRRATILRLERLAPAPHAAHGHEVADRACSRGQRRSRAPSAAGCRRPRGRSHGRYRGPHAAVAHEIEEGAATEADASDRAQSAIDRWHDRAGERGRPSRCPPTGRPACAPIPLTSIRSSTT